MSKIYKDSMQGADIVFGAAISAYLGVSLAGKQLSGGEVISFVMVLFGLALFLAMARTVSKDFAIGQVGLWNCFVLVMVFISLNIGLSYIGIQPFLVIAMICAWLATYIFAGITEKYRGKDDK